MNIKKMIRIGSGESKLEIVGRRFLIFLDPILGEMNEVISVDVIVFTEFLDEETLNKLYVLGREPSVAPSCREKRGLSGFFER